MPETRKERAEAGSALTDACHPSLKAPLGVVSSCFSGILLQMVWDLTSGVRRLSRGHEQRVADICGQALELETPIFLCSCSLDGAPLVALREILVHVYTHTYIYML